MIPPSYAKSVSVKNTTDASVKVTAWFGSEEQEAAGNAKIRETRELAPHEEVHIGDHEYDMGSWTAVAALHSLEVESQPSGALQTAQFKPDVSGIVDVVHVHVKPHPTTSDALHVAAV